MTGLKVLDFSQFLAGPYASLRLADLGANVIKVERKGTGDLSRYLYVSDVQIDGESTVFHAINRGKRSFAVDLKSEVDRDKIWALVHEADVVIQNFRPGVIERLGFGYDAVRERNPKVVYGSVSGYGSGNDWDSLPGQDLLAQARSGVMWLTGAKHHGPVAIGLPVADILAGAALTQGILALLVRRGTTGQGGHVETSLIEAIVDLQFELFSTFLNNGHALPARPGNNAAHAFLAAPYGVYETADGHIAIAMNDLEALFDALGIEQANGSLDPFAHRDQIAACLARGIIGKSTDHCVQKLTDADLWAAPVMNWQELLDSGILGELGMIGSTKRGGRKIDALLSPIRIDGSRPSATGAAPYLDEVPIGWSTD